MLFLFLLLGITRKRVSSSSYPGDSLIHQYQSQTWTDDEPVPAMSSSAMARLQADLQEIEEQLAQNRYEYQWLLQRRRQIASQLQLLNQPMHSLETWSRYDDKSFAIKPSSKKQASTTQPTCSPTQSPTTRQPTPSPTAVPTKSPTAIPTNHPTVSPTVPPTRSPTANPTTRQPTTSPTRFPTHAPTKKPTKLPTTAQPTAAPTEDEDEMLDRIIAGSAQSNTNTIQLYVAEPLTLTTQLEIELLSKPDADLMIIPDASMHSAASVPVKSYWSSADSVLQALQYVFRGLHHLHTRPNPQQDFDGLIISAVDIIKAIPHVFHSSLSFVQQRYGTNSTDSRTTELIQVLYKTNIERTGNTKIPEFHLHSLAVINDFLWKSYAQILELVVSDLLNMLTQSEFSRNSAFPQEIATICKEFLVKSRRIMMQKITQQLTESKRITDMKYMLDSYRDIIYTVLQWNDIVSVVRANWRIADILYAWKYSEKRSFSCVRIVYLRHDIHNRAVLMDELLNALGFESHNIEKYIARSLQPAAKSNAQDTASLASRKRAKQKKQQQKNSEVSQLDMTRYEGTTTAHRYNMLHFMRQWTRGETIQVDSDIIDVYVVKQNSNAHLFHMEQLMIMQHMADIVLFRYEGSLHLVNNVNNDPERKQISALGYAHPIDAVYARLLSFSKWFKNTGREYMRANLDKFHADILTLIDELCKLEKSTIDHIWLTLYTQMEHSIHTYLPVMQYFESLLKMDPKERALLRALQRPVVFATAKFWSFGLNFVLVAFYELNMMKMMQLNHILDHSEYAQSVRFPNNSVKVRRDDIQDGLVVNMKNMQRYFPSANMSERNCLVDAWIANSKDFHMFSTNMHIGHSVFEWKYTDLFMPPGDRIAVAVSAEEWEFHVVSLREVLQKLGYHRENIVVHFAGMTDGEFEIRPEKQTTPKQVDGNEQTEVRRGQNTSAKKPKHKKGSKKRKRV